MQLRFDILIRERITDDPDYAGMISEIERLFNVPVREMVKPRQDFAALLRSDAPGETAIKV
jgi:hypothetical protein